MERAHAELIRRAHTRFDYTVFSSELDPELRPLVRWRRVAVPARPIPLRQMAFFARVSVPLARADVDLVHSLGAVAPNHADVITVSFCHAGSRSKTGKLAPAGSPLTRRANTTIARGMAICAERFCYRPQRVRVLAGVSPGLVRELDEHYGAVRAELTPNGVDLGRFRPRATVRESLRAAEGVAEDDVVCLFVGGDWNRKGLAILLEAMAHPEAPRSLRTWVVGRSNLGRFAGLASSLGVADRVRFVGRRSDVERFYQAADVFVLPSAYETFSLAAHEAAATGLPIVATQVNGVEDLVGDGEAGIPVERTSGAVAAALSTLAGDPALRARLGEEARRRVSRLTWDNAVASILALYEELLERRPT